MFKPRQCGCSSSLYNLRFRHVAPGSCHPRSHRCPGIPSRTGHEQCRLAIFLKKETCLAKYACRASIGSPASLREDEASPLSSVVSVNGSASLGAESDEEDHPDLPEPPILDTRVTKIHNILVSTKERCKWCMQLISNMSGASTGRVRGCL